MAHKKKKLGLPIMVGTLAVLVIGYVGLTEYQANQEEEESIQASLEEEANKIYLNQMEDIVSIQYKNETTQNSFSKTDEKWVVTDLTDFPLEQSYPEEIEGLLQSLTATRKFESPDALEAYGLEKPVLTVCATDTDGNEFTIYFGSTYDSEYYAYINNDESVVYTIEDSLFTATSYGLYDMIVLEELPTLTESNIETIQLELSDETYVIEKEVTIVEVDNESEETTETESTTEEFSTWYITKNDGERQELAEDEKEEVIDMIANAKITGCVNYKANEAELADCGLENDIVTISVTYRLGEEKETMVLHVGNLDAEKSVYYVTLDDSTAINMIEEDIFTALMNGELKLFQ